jgi:hypothetical protein
MAAQGAADDADEPEAHINVLFTSGTLPAAIGNVPSILNDISVEDQRLQCTQFYNFLQEDSPDLLKLNEDIIPRTALISIPRSSKVMLVYGIGRGASPIGTTSNIDGQYLLLTGDAGRELGAPQPIVIPTNLHESDETAAMTHAQFSTTITTKGAQYTYPLLQRVAVTNQVNIMRIAPIPAYLVYDGFTSNLDAAEIYERVLGLENQDSPTYIHLKSFLLSCLNAHNAPDRKPWVPHEVLCQPPSAAAKRWANKKFGEIFPALTAAPPPIVPNGLSPELAALIATALANNTPRQPPPVVQVEEKKGDDNNMGMSDNELEDVLAMCGKPRDADPILLPYWLQECAKKGSETYKLTVIMKHVMQNTYYDDAEVPITRPLLKMILKRQWTGKDGNITRPSMATACEGLSPFAVLDLDEDAVARINDADDALTRASLMTFQDLKVLKNANKAQVPSSPDEFMLTLKRYANLLFAIFSDDCPYFKCVNKVIAALRKFSRSARIGMSKTTKASILWIILLQGRQFAIGQLDVLAEFQAMHTSLTAKQGAIIHAEVPQELLEPPKKPTNKRQSENSEQLESSTQTKKQDIAKKNPNCWNPKLKEALEQPMEKAKNPGLPGFQKILTFCGADPSSVFGPGSRVCSPNAFFGRCYLGNKCHKIHRLANDKETAQILKLVDKFIQDPEEIKKGP